MLQTQDLRVDQEKVSCIWIKIRELDEIPSTKLFILYTPDYWSILHYYQPTLKGYILSLRSTCVKHTI